MAKKTKTLKPTRIMFVLDATGSMSSIIRPTLEGFNAYVQGMKDDQKANGGDVTLTLLQFCSHRGIEKTHFEMPIQEVPELTTETYKPRGGTPLVDATYNSIQALQAALDKKKEDCNVVVCVQTDGEENASTEWTWGQLKELIASKQAAGWQFNFMGAGLDAYKQGAQMGIGAGQTMSYNTSAATTKAAFTAVASSAGRFRTGASMDTSFLSAEKVGAGDQYDPAGATPGVAGVTAMPMTGRVTLNQVAGQPQLTPRTSVDLGGGTPAVKQGNRVDVDLG